MTIPQIGARLAVKRAILSVLRPMTGSRSTGFATVKATGADTRLYSNTYAFAIPVSSGGNGQIDPDLLVKTGVPDRNDPATPWTFARRGDVLGTDVNGYPIQAEGTESWIDVTSAGVQVPIVSVLGGKHLNLSAGMRIRWNPGVPGIEPVSVVSAPGMTGGAPLGLPGQLHRVVLYEHLPGQRAPIDVAAAAMRARLSGAGLFPSACLSLTGSNTGEKASVGGRLRTFAWALVVFTDAGTSTSREEEGAACLDYIESLLDDRGEVDGETFSQPKTSIKSTSSLVIPSDGSDVYVVNFWTFHTTDRIEARSFDAWAEAQISFLTDPTDEYPDPSNALEIVDIKVDMDG